MQELQTIFQERNNDIKLMQSQNKVLAKQDFQQRERVRIQKQNWIIKVVKTNKLMTNENKKNIYEGCLRMMTFYHNVQINNQTVDLQKNFMGEMINLFVIFYSQCDQGDLTAIKKIIRPNNTFVVIDLVKHLIETHRQYFRVKLLETYKEASKLVEEKSKTRLFPTLIPRRELPNTQPSDVEEERKQTPQDSTSVRQKIKQALYQKWQNYVNLSLPNQQNLKNRMNDAYLELLQRNSQNNFMINKFQQKCYGKSRGFAYNVSGLYTQQQIKQMQNKLKYDVKQKFSHIKELRGAPSAQQLKQYFKIKAQIQDNTDKIESKKQNTTPINSWVPIIVNKASSQNNPLGLYVVFNKEQVPIQQFPQKCGLTFKNYLKLILKQRIQKNELKIELSQLKAFKRHHYFDLNHYKKKQLMSEQPRVYSKEKKQSIFPLLRSNQLRQEAQIALKNRSMSEYKLGNSYKHQIYSRKAILNEEQEKTQGNTTQAKIQPSSSFFSKNLNLKEHLLSDKTRLAESKQNLSFPKKTKVDNIIMLILNQRNLNLSNA